MQVVERNEDDDEDNIPLSSGIEVLRRGNADDDDNVFLNSSNNSLVVVGDDEELYGIDDVEAYIEIAVEKVVDDIFEGISDKVDMDMAEEVVKELEDKEADDKQRTAKPKTYKRRKTTKRSMSTRKMVVSESDDEG
ncbi:hypothetical protein Dimus_019968 [Dionaea muscipula]